MVTGGIHDLARWQLQGEKKMFNTLVAICKVSTHLHVLILSVPHLTQHIKKSDPNELVTHIPPLLTICRGHQQRVDKRQHDGCVGEQPRSSQLVDHNTETREWWF